MADESALIMPWGKFQGQAIEEIPNSYVRWLAENCSDEAICEATDKELAWREKFDINIKNED